MAPRHALLAVSTGFVVFVIWILFDRGWAAFSTSGPGFVPLRADGQVDFTLAFLRLAGLGLVVPIMEELFWRSFLLRWIEAPRHFVALDPRRVGVMPVAVTGALFALEHSLWFAGLIAGISYTLVYMRSRNLWAAVLSHAITNTTLGAWILATGNWRLW